MTKNKHRKERKNYTEEEAKAFSEAVNSSARKVHPAKKNSTNNIGVRGFGRESAINGSVLKCRN